MKPKKFRQPAQVRECLRVHLNAYSAGQSGRALMLNERGDLLIVERHHGRKVRGHRGMVVTLRERVPVERSWYEPLIAHGFIQRPPKKAAA